MTEARAPIDRFVVALALLTAGLVATSMAPPRPWLVWNASASAPVGLYRVGAPGDLARGDMVVAWVPAPARKLAAARHYLPGNVPLIKRVAAISGDEVCAVGDGIFIAGRRVASRRARDGKGRAMPRWQGCERLGEGALFLLMDAPDSFDGRYFGITRRADIVGRARPIWTR